MVVIFEGGDAALASLVLPDWLRRLEARSKAYLVYGVSTSRSMRAALRRAHHDCVGNVYVTDDQLPNPWDTLPAYFDEETRHLHSRAPSSPGCR